MPDKPPAGQGYTSFRLAGIDVIEDGLPPLPDVLTHDMTTPIPIGYWAARESAVVAFFYFQAIPEASTIQPVVMDIPYYREAGKWTVETTGLIFGEGFPFDPVTEPGRTDDLDGSPIVYGSTGRVQSPGKPLLRTASGRASSEVAQLSSSSAAPRTGARSNRTSATGSCSRNHRNHSRWSPTTAPGTHWPASHTLTRFGRVAIPVSGKRHPAS